MNHSPSKALMNTRTVRSLPVSHSRYQPVHYNHSCLMCLGIHSILQHIIMYISTHLYIYLHASYSCIYIYLHASYSHIHVTKPRTCNNTTNMYQCCRYVTILRICNNTTNTYIYRCYNNLIYNNTILTEMSQSCLWSKK